MYPVKCSVYTNIDMFTTQNINCKCRYIDIVLLGLSLIRLFLTIVMSGLTRATREVV